MTDLNLKDKFRENYAKANMQQGTNLWAKGLLISPLFSSSQNIPAVVTATDVEAANEIAERIECLGLRNVSKTSQNAITIKLEKDDLIGTNYNKMYFYGFPLNSEMQLLFMNHVVERLQAQLNEPTYKNDPSLVIIDIDMMVMKLGLDPKQKPFYKEVFLDMNNRLNHSYLRYELTSGVTVNDSYVYKFSHNDDKSLFETKFGDVFLESVAKDTWRKKINYVNLMSLKGGTARILYSYIDSLEFKGVAHINVNTVLKTLSLDGERKSKVKVLNRAMDYLVSIGFISEIKEVVYNRSVVEKIITVNRGFDLAEFAEVEREKDSIAKQKKIRTRRILPVVKKIKEADVLSKEEALKAIEIQFAQMNNSPATFLNDDAWTTDNWDENPNG